MFLFSIQLFAQEFSVEVVYQSKSLTKIGMMNVDGVSLNDEKQKEIQAKIDKMFEKTHTLIANKTESVYHEEQKLTSSTSGGQNYQAGILDGDLYKNLKTKMFKRAQESSGKNFIVSDSLIKYDWKLESETKKIGNYTCNKAIYIKKVTAQELKDYENEKSENEKNKTNFLKSEPPKDKITTTWYTTEIPVSHGPTDFWGLPGLILEIKNDAIMILCSKISINPKKAKTIKIPKNGKIVSQKTFDKMEEDAYNKMFEENKGINIIENKN